MYRLAFIAFCLNIAALTATAAELPREANRVSFQVSVSEDIASDLLVVRMFVQHQARQQAQAANRVNEDMAWALALAKSVTAVRAQTLDYRTNPVYQERRIESWQTRQTLRLESADMGALTALLGTLQERLAIESLGYEISDDVRAAAEERLIARAIENFSARAAGITTAFGRDRYTLVNLGINTQGEAPPPIAYRGRALAMQAEVAAPSIEAGQQSLSVAINGTIELSEQ